MLHQVSGIGGTYDVRLDDPEKVVYHKLAEALPIRFAILTGKHTGELEYVGELYRVSVCGAKIRTEESIPKFTNLKIAVDHAGREITQSLSGKVVRGTSEDLPSIEVIFTFVPYVAQKFFKEILASDQSMPKQPTELTESVSQPVVAAKLTEKAAEKAAEKAVEKSPEKSQDCRGSYRRRSAEPIALPITMEDGTTFKTMIGDFSLDGMFLSISEQPPQSGAKGSFTVALHDHVQCFVFEVAHAYQNGVGIRITQDHDIYSLALLDGVFGEFFPLDT